MVGYATETLLCNCDSPRIKIISQVEYGTGNSGADLTEIIFIPGATITEGEEGVSWRSLATP